MRRLIILGISIVLYGLLAVSCTGNDVIEDEIDSVRNQIKGNSKGLDWSTADSLRDKLKNSDRAYKEGDSLSRGEFNIFE